MAPQGYYKYLEGKRLRHIQGPEFPEDYFIKKTSRQKS